MVQFIVSLTLLHWLYLGHSNGQQVEDMCNPMTLGISTFINIMRRRLGSHWWSTS